jgi:hypothetical protein
MGHVVETRDPHVLVMNACRWVKADPERWGRLVELCEWFAAMHPGRRLRRGDLWVYAQQKGMSVTLCEEFRFDNSLWSVLSRYAIMCRPKLAAAIRPRASGVDSVHLRAVWALVVGDPSCLVLEDWRQAE